MRWIDALAKKNPASGGADAASRMAEAYEASSRGDYARALELWSPLAHAGVARAQSNIGALYASGWGVERNPACSKSVAKSAVMPRSRRAFGIDR